MMKKLYTSYVRPQLELAIPVWIPYLNADIYTLERVQHRATNFAKNIKNQS